MTARERIERMQRDAEELRDMLRAGQGEAEETRHLLGKLAFTVSEAIHALRSE